MKPKSLIVKHTELLDTQLNAGDEPNKETYSRIINTESVEGSPFTLVTIEAGTFVALGNRRCTEPMEEEEAKQIITSGSWELITALIVAIMTDFNNIKDHAKN